MTFAFNIDEVFQQVLGKDNDVLRYVVKDDPLGEEESIGHDRDVIFAAGSYLGRAPSTISCGSGRTPSTAIATSTTSSCWSTR